MGPFISDRHVFSDWENVHIHTYLTDIVQSCFNANNLFVRLVLDLDDPCNSSKECDLLKNLICSSSFQRCVCNNDSYHRNRACYLSKNIKKKIAPFSLFFIINTHYINSLSVSSLCIYIYMAF